MSPVYLRSLGIPRNQPEDREGLFITRRPGRGHLGHSSECQDTEGNHINSAINSQIKQNPQTRGLEEYGSSSSAPPAPQRSFPIEHGQQEVQPKITLGRTWRKLQKICLKEISLKELIITVKGWNPTRKFRLLEERETRIRENKATI
ncbi:hypothetical protein O181_016482 [Austropuccinia psidii MF-1]|uniref:Uncharacterized protein n=1 Tax=Austropuccinia psidii MF-1 TaxID=1389203 RepID=A0A9Q3C439_9BASI|nr:hypothetical protein [Austropuccinia psidii MF-1]